MNTADEDLLSIDVDAEIRKLCGEQFSSPVEHVVALVRYLVLAGSRRIRLRISRRVVIEADRATLPTSVLSYLEQVADQRANSRHRHQALAAIESLEGSPLLAMLSLEWGVISVPQREGTTQLVIQKGMVRRRKIRLTKAVVLALTIKAKRAQLRYALMEACRFARVPVFIDGDEVQRSLHLEDCLLTARFREGPIEGIVGLPRHQSLCRVTYLLGQVVWRERVRMSRRGSVHVAVVQAPNVRRAEELPLRRMEAEVVRMRERLYESVRKGFFEMRPGDREAARDLFFRRGEKGDQSLLVGLAIFERLEGEAVDLEGLQRAATDGVLFAVEPDTRPRRWMVGPEQIFVLDRRARRFVSAQCGLTVVQPAVRAGDSVWHRLHSRLFGWHRNVGPAVQSVWARLLGARPVPAADLRAEERALLEALEAEVQSGRFVLPGMGQESSQAVHVEMLQRGPLPAKVRRLGAGWVLGLPRQNPLVRQAVRAYAADPRVLYIVYPALLGGHNGFAKARSTGQRKLLAATDTYAMPEATT